MRRAFSVVIGITTLSALLQAQTITSSEINRRLSLNRDVFPQSKYEPDLAKLVQDAGTDVTRIARVNQDEAFCGPDCAPPDPTNHPAVRMAAVGSDLVAVAHDISNVSSLSSDHRSVVTDDEMVVDDVWAASSSQTNINQGSEVTVVSPGGHVSVAGHQLTTGSSIRRPFQVGHKYLLFLQYLPGSESYKTYHLDGYDLTGNAVVPVKTNLPQPDAEFYGAPSAFLGAMHSSVQHALAGDHQ